MRVHRRGREQDVGVVRSQAGHAEAWGPDPEAVREQVQGHTILVSGAGGSVGAELSRQVAACRPARLVLLDHHDQRLISTWESLGRPAHHGWDDLVLADVRDLPTLTAVMLDVRPDVVFHAAALNDRTLLERHPREAWLTNVGGTRNMLQAATQAGVGTFVTISSRTGADHDTVLGRTQLQAERLTTSWAHEHLGRFLAVRPGNSHDPALPVPVDETCRLVLAATALGIDGRVVDSLPAQLDAV